MSDEIVEPISDNSTESQVSPLDLSDDKIEEMGFNEFQASVPEDESTDEVEESSEETTSDEVEDESTEELDDDTEQTVYEDEESTDTTEEDVVEETEEVSETAQAQLDRLFSPFKANGKDIKVDSIDEAITLMQMGANYNKKMAGLKPNLKLLKTLENNGLLDESKINYLIDLDKKKPEAINKLINDSGIDPLDIDVSDEDYVPNTYTVNDKELELDSVLEEIQDTPAYNSTIDILSNKWDEKSRQLLVENPQIIKVINEHVENGLYEQITSLVEKERTFGRLTGLSDIEAYKVTGDKLFSNQEATKKPAIVKRPTTKKTDPKVTNKKKAASSTKGRPSQKQTEFNPLSLSDAEFEKISEKFL